jgi:Flp pilus assembly protein CpaB
VIVQNARVLASGSDTTSINERLGPDKKAAASPARTVTLDVSTRDALRISTARQLGRLGLTMRAAEDNKVSPELEVSAGEVGGELPKKKTADRVITSTCTRGHYRVNGREFQLNCDGTSLQLDGGDE